MSGNTRPAILIVDDDQGSRELYRALLTPFGYEVLEARDGREALDIAGRRRPDLIISDILMPTMNGYEFVSMLRKDPAMADVPVIFNSASFLDNETRTLGAACGVSLFILKPCEPDKALSTIQCALGLKVDHFFQSTPASPERDDAIPLLIDAFYAKGQQLDALSLRLASLLEVALDLAKPAMVDALLRIAGDGARKIVGANYAGIGILSAGGSALKSFALFGVASDIRDRLASASFSGEVFASILKNHVTHRSFSPFGEPPGLDLPPGHPPVKSFLAVPLKTGNQAYGWIYVAEKLASLAFTDEDAQALNALAAYLAIAYESAQRFDMIEERTRRLEDEVAERKRAEERFRMLVETAPTGIIIVDSNGRIVDSNVHSLKMFGYLREELVGQQVEMLLPEAIKQTHRKHRASYASSPRGRPMGMGMELFARRKDGSDFPVEISLGPLATRGEMLVSAAIVDITERKKMEERLRVSQRMEAIGKLAGGVAHDFNNLLTVILGCCDQMSGYFPADHPGIHKMEMVKKAASSAADVTRQLLAFGRKQIMQPQVIDPTQILNAVGKMIARLIGEDVEFSIAAQPDVGFVSADPGQLEQVLMNLATNARDAMPAGGRLAIKLANADLDEEYKTLHPPVVPGHYIVIEVADTGCGMDAKTQAKIFDPFFTTKEIGKGTGLGLATVYGIVKQTGGYIWVYSEVAKGTVFRVYLPRVEQPTHVAISAEADPPPPRGCETILLAEDSESLREIAEEYLQSLGYEVIAAESGAHAVELADKFSRQIHLLLTDVVMPGMSGRELADALTAKRPGTKVLYSSGYTDDAIVRQGVLEPGIAFIQKPYRPKALARKVREVLDSNKADTCSPPSSQMELTTSGKTNC
jgi:PAS domain S-box-containing protein